MTDVFTDPLVPLPAQPADVAWPGPGPDRDWPEGDVPENVRLAPLLDAMFDEQGPLRTTYAVVVIHGGRVVGERCAGELEHWGAPPEPVVAETKLLSWSMAKSMLHAVVGV